MVSERQVRDVTISEDISERLMEVSRLTSGNIVEIGGGEGQTTVRFLRVAKEKNVKVIVVDPFEQIDDVPKSYFEPYPLDKFMETVEGYSEYLHLIKRPSQHSEVVPRLESFQPIGFMFIDGQQDKESVLKDLITAQLLRAEVISVDDYDRLTDSSQVPLAVMEFLKTTIYKLVNIGKREVYFTLCV